MGYFGSKATSGLCQALIALMPPHSVYIESHLGGGALMKRKPTGVRSIGIDRELLSKVGDGGFQAARSISFSPSLNLTPSTISARR